MSKFENTGDSMLEMYLFESSTLLEQLDEILLQSEEDGLLSEESVNEIFRIMHTIKGSSAMMEFDTLAAVSHKLEDLFYIIRENGLDEEHFSELMDLVLKVSNFHHRSGGMLESIKLGKEKNIAQLRYENLAKEFILFGSLMVLGAYHLALFLFRKKNRSSLYFGIFCLMVGVRTLFVGERFFMHLFPQFSWELAHKMQTLVFYLGVPLILMFFISVYPKYFHAPIIKIAQIIGAAFGLLVLLAPARIFTPFNPIYQVWSAIIIIYIFVMILRIFKHKEKGIHFILIGAIALLWSSANDIIFLSIWMNDSGSTLLRALIKTGNLSLVGQFIFAFTMSLSLAKNFSDALQQEEVLTAQLKDINHHLDELVLRRTEDLEKSNQKIEHQKIALERANEALTQLSMRDPLTGVWNRRKYNEAREKAWGRCIRYQRSFALILIDIDNFKQFNDCSGHMAGDQCLIQIAKTLDNSLSRSSEMVARYGGEEFVVLLTDLEKEEALKVAYLLREKIEALHIPHQHSHVSNFVTVSAGVTFAIPDLSSSYEDLFTTVDSALYKAKEAGKNRVVFFIGFQLHNLLSLIWLVFLLYIFIFLNCGFFYMVY
jgi:diguanylate cyclase (GGDEF)-like protein